MSIIGVTVHAADASGICVPQARTEEDKPWEVLLKHLKDGTYKAAYEVGEFIPIHLGRYGDHKARIVAMDTDQISGSDRKAAFTFLLSWLLPEKMKMNNDWATEDPDVNDQYLPGTGAVNGWLDCDLRKRLKQEVFPEFPEIVRDNIVPVSKTSRTFTENCQIFDVVTTDKIWIPSRREIFGKGLFTELSGPVYDGVFDDDESRVMLDKDGDPSWWWLRSANINYYFYFVNSDGNYNYYNAYTEGGVVVGFCLGSGI